MLASGSSDLTIRVWDVKTHQSLGPPLRMGEGAINSQALARTATTWRRGAATVLSGSGTLKAASLCANFILS